MSDPFGNKAKLLAKVALVSKEVGSIGKEKADPGGQVAYKFQKWDTILPQLRDACAKHKVWVIPSVDEIQKDESTNKNGTVMSDWTLNMSFEIIDCETGESITAKWVGESADSGDKGAQKAATSGTKYFLLKAFMIPSAEVEDNDGTTVERGKPVEPAPQGEPPKEDPPATKLDIAMLKLGLSPKACQARVTEKMKENPKLTKAQAGKQVAEEVIKEAGL